MIVNGCGIKLLTVEKRCRLSVVSYQLDSQLGN